MTAGPPHATDLARLIDTEQRSEALLASARKQAEVILEDARTGVAADDRAVAGEIERAVEELKAHLEEGREAEERAIAVEAKRVADAYDRVSDNAVAGMADHIMARLLSAPGLEGGGPP